VCTSALQVCLQACVCVLLVSDSLSGTLSAELLLVWWARLSTCAASSSRLVPALFQ
jgi:hypothetical protein